MMAATSSQTQIPAYSPLPALGCAYKVSLLLIITDITMKRRYQANYRSRQRRIMPPCRHGACAEDSPQYRNIHAGSSPRELMNICNGHLYPVVRGWNCGTGEGLVNGTREWNPWNMVRTRGTWLLSKSTN